MIFDRIFKPKLEQRAHPSADLNWADVLGIGGASASGITVTEDTVLTSATVYACVRVLSQSLAALPLLATRRPPPDVLGEAGGDASTGLHTTRARRWRLPLRSAANPTRDRRGTTASPRPLRSSWRASAGHLLRHRACAVRFRSRAG